MLLLLCGCGAETIKAETSSVTSAAEMTAKSGDGTETKTEVKTESESEPEMELEPELIKFTDTIYDCFDTITAVTAYCVNEEYFNVLMDRIRSELTEYHRLYDIYNSYDGMTNLHDVNELAPDGPVAVPDAVKDIVLFAKEMYTLTDGNMNIAFGAVLKLWHEAREFSLEHPDQAYIPELSDLQAAAEHCDIDTVLVDEKNNTVTFTDPELSLDAGAIAKGYSVERIAQGLIADGYDHILINAGGNVRAIGAKPGDKDWVVGITNPDTSSTQPYAQTVSVRDEAVVTSGNYQRYYTLDGVNYHHIINKDTLMPANYFRSVTIVTGDSGRADALSTAVFNMNRESGKKLLDSLGDTEGVWIE